MNNALNFSGGPGVLPACVLEATQKAIAEVPEVGLSILGISHRSDWFASVVAEAEHNIRQLLGLSDEFAVLFLQGGATLQFSMVPMLLLRGTGRTAEYLNTGYWSSKAVPEAALEGPVRVAWDGQPEGFRRLPRAGEIDYQPDAAYLHYVSNETVEGLQFHHIPGLDSVKRVCDMSSDFLSRPVDTRCFDLIYAHAQKNLGPAGVTVVVLRRSLLEQAPAGLPAMLDYRNHLNTRSIYNTPPVFAIYVTLLVTRWLLHTVGGLAAMNAINQRKAQTLYQVLDDYPEVFKAWAQEADRSLMNVVWRFDQPSTEAEFLKRARGEGFGGLNGHRSLGGVRASIYNAMTPESVGQLADLMRDFARAR